MIFSKIKQNHINTCSVFVIELKCGKIGPNCTRPPDFIIVYQLPKVLHEWEPDRIIIIFIVIYYSIFVTIDNCAEHELDLLVEINYVGGINQKSIGIPFFAEASNIFWKWPLLSSPKKKFAIRIPIIDAIIRRKASL